MGAEQVVSAEASRTSALHHIILDAQYSAVGVSLNQSGLGPSGEKGAMSQLGLAPSSASVEDLRRHLPDTRAMPATGTLGPWRLGEGTTS